MIAKFMAGLSPLGRILFAGAVGIVVIMLFDILLLGPTMSRLQTIDQEIDKEKSSIKQDLHFLEYKNKILKESQAVEPYLVQELPAEEEIIAAFLKKIEVLATKSNVTLIKVTPSPGSQEKEFLKYQADLECSGKLADVIMFMHLVDTSEDLMKVMKFSFSNKKAESDDLKAIMSINKIIVTKQGVALPSMKTPASADGSKPAPDTATTAKPSDAAR